MKITLFLQPDGDTVRIGTRGRGNGLDCPRAALVSADAREVVLRVPGHREANGYDRMNGGTQYEYIPAATHRLPLLDRWDDRYGVVGFTVELA